MSITCVCKGHVEQMCDTWVIFVWNHFSFKFPAEALDQLCVGPGNTGNVRVLMDSLAQNELIGTRAKLPGPKLFSQEVKICKGFTWWEPSISIICSHCWVACTVFVCVGWESVGVDKWAGRSKRENHFDLMEIVRFYVLDQTKMVHK